MADTTWGWHREYQEIREELTRRWQYRLKGRPYPTELTNAQEIIATLERMKPILQEQINKELEAQATAAMEAVADTYVQHLMNPTSASGSRSSASDMPQTSSEQQLQQVKIMQGWAARDAAEQERVRFHLNHYKYCETDCPYPDRCGDTKWRHDCLLTQLSLRSEVRGFFGTKIVPPPYTESDIYALKRIGRACITSGSGTNRSCEASGNMAVGISPSCAGIGRGSFWGASITAARGARRMPLQ